MMESGGLIEALTTHMLVESCRWANRWKDQGLEPLRISVNVSAHNLSGPEVADRYEDIIREHGLAPEWVILEITESSVMSDTARGLGLLARLRLKGFGLSVDDFGTGYSSLTQLSQIPFTELKIDQGFVGGSPDQPRKARGDRDQPGPGAQARPERGRRRRGNDGGMAAAGAAGLRFRPGLPDLAPR